MNSADKVRRFHQAASSHLAAIQELLQPEMKLTLIARHPNHHERDIVVTGDTIDGIQDVITRARSREAT